MPRLWLMVFCLRRSFELEKLHIQNCIIDTRNVKVPNGTQIGLDSLADAKRFHIRNRVSSSSPLSPYQFEEWCSISVNFTSNEKGSRIPLPLYWLNVFKAKRYPIKKPCQNGPNSSFKERYDWNQSAHRPEQKRIAMKKQHPLTARDFFTQSLDTASKPPLVG